MWLIQNFQLQRKLKQITAALHELQTPQTPVYIIDLWQSRWDETAPLPALLREASILAGDVPQLKLKVFEAALTVMDSPAVNFANHQLLADLARPLARTEHEHERLNNRTAVLPASTTCIIVYDKGTPLFSGFTETIGNMLAATDAAVNGEQRKQDMLAGLAMLGCANNNWKQSYMLAEVTARASVPDTAKMIVTACPDFTETVCALGLESTRLYRALATASQSCPELLPARQRLARQIFEKHFLPPSNTPYLFDDIAAVARTDAPMQANLVALTLGKVVFSLRHGHVGYANNLIDLADKLSGGPLDAFTPLASRELCLWGVDVGEENARGLITSKHALPAEETCPPHPLENMVIWQGSSRRDASMVTDMLIKDSALLSHAGKCLIANVKTAHITLGRGKPLLQVWADLCQKCSLGSEDFIQELRKCSQAPLAAFGQRTVNQLDIQFR